MTLWQPTLSADVVQYWKTGANSRFSHNNVANEYKIF